MKIYIFLILLLSGQAYAESTWFGLYLIPQIGVGNDYTGKRAVAGRGGISAQIGPSEHGDGTSGAGLLLGVIGDRAEIGAGYVAMSMGSFLLQGATRWSFQRQSEFAGAHVTGGFGFAFFLGYLRAGYDKIEESGLVEIGAIFPIPVNWLLR